MYCKSFLRLAGKTQVYAPSSGDHRRTRLTHTLEVSQIARTVAKALCLDCDLTEAIALGHDIGHTPFGHAGEQILHEIMSPPEKDNSLTVKATVIYKKLKDSPKTDDYSSFYGFKHNLQSVRCTVEDLESRDRRFGLDLTNYTLWGIMHHSSYSYKEGRVATEYIVPHYYDHYMQYWMHDTCNEAWSFEAFIVAEADEIAQMHHDLEDAIRGKALSEKEVLNLLGKLESLMDVGDKDILYQLKNGEVTREYLISSVSKIIVNTLVSTLYKSSRHNLLKLIKRYEDDGKSISEIFKRSYKDQEIVSLIGYDVELSFSNSKIIGEFHNELSNTGLYTYDVQRSDSKGKYIIKNLFEAYYTNPQQLPDSALRNLYKILRDNDYKLEPEEDCFRIESAKLRKAIFKAVRSIIDNEDINYDILIMRSICDYIAGMTDNFAISEYEKLYG